jgi:hypothetical protein
MSGQTTRKSRFGSIVNVLLFTVRKRHLHQRIVPRSSLPVTAGVHQKRIAPKYRYPGTPSGCILTSSMDETRQIEEIAASQVQVVGQGIRSGLGGGADA